MKSIFFVLFFIIPAFVFEQVNVSDNLVFDSLAKRWDAGMPLGNGMLGALVWQKNGHLRVSLDRADLWDERTAMDISKFNFKFVEQQLKKNEYDTIHKLGDWPYDNIAYPTKLPGGALEFDISKFAAVKKVSLDITTALSVVEFANGVKFNIYVHAINNVGYFGFENIADEKIIPQLIIPNYTGNAANENDNSHSGEGLSVLGYAKGTVTETANSIRYHQPTYGQHYYEILIQWKKFSAKNVIGEWTISNDKPATLTELNTSAKEPTNWPSHIAWWKKFWTQSSINIPDEQLQKQYYLEMYKLGCVARKAAPAITLQAIWTADNGSLPPWKGDFHHDLNTQLSYWPSYTGNHLQEASTYTDWLWNIRNENKKYTRDYFGVNGLAVPGVTTIAGAAMGGWIQYSLSPSVSSWLAEHFYWQWKYSMDENFLKEKAYPYLHDVATFIENLTYIKDNKRYVALSSSPEYHDNNTNAWFNNFTNYDLSLYKFALNAAAEAATAMNKKDEAAHWKNILQQFPPFDENETGLTIAPGQNLDESHRHHAHLMPIYPLCQLDANNEADKKLMNISLRHLEKEGTRNWCGYSFTWAACLYARAKEADSAAKQLKIFASNFCSPNSFHLNGDQYRGEYSSFTYSPFTLEGNFAFAQGVHELLLQSKTNYIEVFPAVPENWKDVSFTNLRAEGAFLISAKKENGVSTEVKIFSEKGGRLHIKLPYKTWVVKNVPRHNVQMNDDGTLSIQMGKGQVIIFENGYE